MPMPDYILASQLVMAKIYLGIGVAEEPMGSNAGFWVEEMQEDAGINKGDAWCMAGVFSCHLEGCRNQRRQKPYLKRTGWCKGQWLWAHESPKLTVIGRDQIINGWQIPDGAIWIKVREDGTGHCGFVYDHDPKKNEMKSIEFNHGNKADWDTYLISNIADFQGVII